MRDRRHTRDELLAHGLRLFAERGFDAVSVGEIEQAVGLVPRRGALYRHFASKDALLEAAVRDYLDSVAQARDRFTAPTAPDPNDTDPNDTDAYDTALALARWILGELDRQHEITRILEQDGDRLRDLRDAFRRDVSEPGYAAMAEIVGSWWAPGTPPADVTALAVHLLGGLVNARRSTWTFGGPPADLDDERLARGWADMCTRLLGGAEPADAAHRPPASTRPR